jgi:hypothetical protein
MMAIGLVLSLGPHSGDGIHAADIFTKVTTGPGADFGNSRSAAWGDFDGDNFVDLFVAQTDPGGNGSTSHFLYHNNRDGTFTRVTSGVIAEAVSDSRGAAWGDFNNDGYLDLIVVNIGQPNYLFQNKGDGSFIEIPDSAFVSDIANSRTVTWVDYDNDGYLDIFRAAFDEPRRLYRNNHNGTFTRVIQPAFLTVPGVFFGVTWADFNNDGRPDLFLPQGDEDGGFPSSLYQNAGGGAFARVAAGILDGTFNGVGAAAGDYDNDGDLDLFVACAYAPGDVSRPNLLYRQDANGKWTKVTSLPASDSENKGGASSSCNWGDYDNDGWLDLFVTNRGGQNNYLYHNNRDGTFTKILDSVVVNDGAFSYSSAWGDYDNDGFLDLFVGNGGELNLLYHNNGNDNQWLKLRLVGTRSNRSAIGAKVHVRATISGQTFWQMREVSGGDGLRGQDSLHVHFGLGNAPVAELVRIEWPSGEVQTITNVPPRQLLQVTEPGGEPSLITARENGISQLTLVGKQSSEYLIEAATTLPNWKEAGLTVLITNQSGSVTFPAPDGAASAQRFFRARLH